MILDRSSQIELKSFCEYQKMFKIPLSLRVSHLNVIFLLLIPQSGPLRYIVFPAWFNELILLDKNK